MTTETDTPQPDAGEALYGDRVSRLTAASYFVTYVLCVGQKVEEQEEWAQNLIRAMRMARGDEEIDPDFWDIVLSASDTPRRRKQNR